MVAIERGLSLEQLAARANKLKGNTGRARYIISTLGTDDPELLKRYPQGAEKLRLDPRNITDFHNKLPRVIAINQRLLRSIERQEQEHDETATQVSQRITEKGELPGILGDFVLVDEETQKTQAYAQRGLLSPKVVEGLQARAQEITTILDLHRRGSQILEERRRVEEPAPSEEPEPRQTVFRIDEETQGIEADGKPLGIIRDHLRGVFIELAKDATGPGKGIPKRELETLARELAFTGKRPFRQCMDNLNRIFERQRLAARVIQIGHEMSARLRLINVTVEFIPSEPKVGIPEEALTHLAPMERKAVLALPFLSKPDLPADEVFTTVDLAKKLTGKASPTSRERATARTFLSRARKKLKGCAIVSNRLPGKSNEYSLFATTTAIAEELKRMALALPRPNPAKRKSSPERPRRRPVREGLTPFAFPNGQKLSLSAQELRFVQVLPFYPQRGFLRTNDLIDMFYGEQVVSGTLERGAARNRISRDFIDHMHHILLEARVVVINQVLPRARWQGASYFGVAVNLEPMTDREKRIAQAVMGQYALRGHLVFEELQRDIFRRNGNEIVPEEIENLHPLLERELLVGFACAYMKMMKDGQEPGLWENMKANLLKKPTKGEMLALLRKLLAEIIRAGNYFDAQGLPQPSLGRLIKAG